tara:strand:- start:13015 stop:13398 length:384 start_codon:yes stop_codon:yes gene_type:complete
MLGSIVEVFEDTSGAAASVKTNWNKVASLVEGKKGAQICLIAGGVATLLGIGTALTSAYTARNAGKPSAPAPAPGPSPAGKQAPSRQSTPMSWVTVGILVVAGVLILAGLVLFMQKVSPSAPVYYMG